MSTQSTSRPRNPVTDERPPALFVVAVVLGAAFVVRLAIDAVVLVATGG